MPKTTHAPLLDHQVRALRPGETPIDVRDGQARGLILTVLPSGRKQFSVRYVFQGKHKRLILGDYPTLSLAKARDAAEDVRVDIRDGKDPVGERRAAKAERTDTVKALAGDYLDEHARPNKRTAAEDERVLNAEILPQWGDRSVRDITRADVKALIRRIVKRGSPIMANRTLALIRKVLNYAVDEEWIDANPAARIKKPAPETSRERVLTDDEIRRFWRVLSNLAATSDKPAPGRKRNRGDDDDPLCPVSDSLAALLKVRLLTAQRGGEIAKMKWSDIDLDTGWWTIPGADTKNRRPHRVYLVDEARAIVQAQQPADDEAEDDEKPAYVFSGRTRAKKGSAKVADTLNLDIRGHDLRRTAATRMAAAGIPREHVARVLNHVEGGPRATAVYDRYQYDREKQVALETWARVLTAVLEGKDASKVLPFTAATK